MTHLCNTCQKEFATCGVNKITFGIDADPRCTEEDADAVLDCDGYVPHTEQVYVAEDRVVEIN